MQRAMVYKFDQIKGGAKIKKGKGESDPNKISTTYFQPVYFGLPETAMLTSDQEHKY